MGIAPPYIGPELPADPAWPAGFTKDAWGMGYQAQAYATGSYNEQVYFPLASAETHRRSGGLSLAVAGLV